MPFARPTLTEIIDRVIADIGSRVVGVEGAVMRRSLLGILGRAEAGAVHQLYGYIDWVARQAIPDTAEAEWLERWARIWNITRKPADFASGLVVFNGTSGTVVPDGTVVQRQDGAQYVTQGAGLLVDGTVTIAVLATAAGVRENVVAGVALSLLSPVAGVQSNAVVAVGGIAGGNDVESDDRLLARLLERIQNPPQGGAAADYVQWALEVSGVTRVWVYPLQMGAGTVTVLFVTDDDPGGVIPGPAKVEEVQAKIEAERPVTAEVFVAAPVEDPLSMTIKLQPNNASTQAAVLAELQDLLTRDAAPGQPILISRLREAVSIAVGESNNQIVTPTADVAHATGHMATLGVVTFQPL